MDVVRLLEQVKAVLQERPAQRLDGADQLDVFCISCMFIRTCRKSKGPCVGVCLLAGCANIRFFVHHYALRTVHTSGSVHYVTQQATESSWSRAESCRERTG